MDLRDRICLVTGASSGLGLAVAQQFANKGATTILMVRNQAKGQDAINEIKKTIPDASLDLMICDLASLKSVQNFIREFKSKYSKLDILYNNAAVMKQKRTLTPDGIEMMFQVNYLSPFVIMNEMLELLKHGGSPLIINNGRPADKYRFNPDDLQFSKNYNMFHSFFITKLYLLFATLELSESEQSKGVDVIMVDPGPFKSKLVREIPFMGWIKNLFSNKVETAAENILYHVESNSKQDKNGKVFKEKSEHPQPTYWRDNETRKTLWAKTDALIREKLNT